MAGTVYKMIQKIIEQRAKGDKLLAEMTKTKIIMKGININHYHSTTPDDEQVIQKLRALAKELHLDI